MALSWLETQKMVVKKKNQPQLVDKKALKTL